MANKDEVLLQPVMNPLLQEVVDVLDSFIESISCIKETYEFSEITLRTHLNETIVKYNTFISGLKRVDPEGKVYLEIPEANLREWNRLFKKKSRAKRAVDLVPPSYFVSLVSAYDTFFGDLIRCLYNICPEKLQEEEMSFNYRELQHYRDLADVKKRIVDKRVETLLRESHVAQIDWLAKALGVESLTSAFIGWKDFVEITERRNLFVHANGTVSAQYVENCKKHSALDDSIFEGNQLSVDKEYFDRAFKTLYKTAIMLTQMLLRVKYSKKFDNNCVSEIDKILIVNVYDLIYDKYYDVAIDVSEMVLKNQKFKHNAFDRMYLVLNYAQAYKWSGNSEKCLSILGEEDWTAYTNELLIPKFALEENYPEVFTRMRELGKSNKHITSSSYREWPIFQLLREQQEFERVFSEIFGEEFERTIMLEDNQGVERTDTVTTAKVLEIVTPEEHSVQVHGGDHDV